MECKAGSTYMAIPSVNVNNGELSIDDYKEKK